MTEEKRVTIEIDAQLYAKLEALAEKLGRNIDDLAEENLRKVMDDPEKYLKLNP